MLAAAIDMAERGLVSDRIIRSGIRKLLNDRLHDIEAGDPSNVEQFAEELRTRPIAECTAEANDQHYEVPAALYQAILGPRLKYSSGYWPEGVDTLAASEEAMLELTGRRAGIEDGMDLLDLGCGWGSFSLWAAERYPGCRITSVSNSASQKAFIEQRAAEKGFSNLTVVTADINQLVIGDRFDRIISIEMFEHMRNYALLLERISGWLRPGGKLFVHIFTHRKHPYLFETEGAHNWMGRYFFSGGTMPSHDLLGQFSEHLRIEQDWRVNGTHYARTLEAWLEKLDSDPAAVRRILEPVYGRKEAKRWVQRWRMFLMSCAELFAYRDGEEWCVSHYRMGKT